MTALSRLSAVLSLAFAALSGCSDMGSLPNPFAMANGTIHVEAHAKAGGSPIQRSGQPVVLMLGEIADVRPGAPARKIGSIGSTIIDISDTSLKLDQDVAAAVLAALKSQLAADGYRVVAESDAPHDFVIDAKIRAFRLDIVDQDRLDIGVDLALRDGSGGEVLWAGSVSEQSSRFAGIAGDSRETIVAYLSRGLGAWAVKASANIGNALLKSFPQTMAISERSVLPALERAGVQTLQEARPREGAAAPNAGTIAPAVALPAAPAPANAARGDMGSFSIVTVPARAKIYIGDIYYGVSPLKLDLPAGIIACHFELEGYKSVAEKVSIRSGETTELEVKFAK